MLKGAEKSADLPNMEEKYDKVERTIFKMVLRMFMKRNNANQVIRILGNYSPRFQEYIKDTKTMLAYAITLKDKLVELKEKNQGDTKVNLWPEKSLQNGRQYERYARLKARERLIAEQEVTIFPHNTNKNNFSI